MAVGFGLDSAVCVSVRCVLLWLGHAGEVCLFLCLGAGVCAGVWRLLAAGGGGEEMEVMGIIGAVEQERRWRVHVVRGGKEVLEGWC